MITDFNRSRSGKGFVAISMPRGKATWAPIMTDGAYPTKNFTKLSHLHTLWKLFATYMNIGHVIWEEFGMIYYSMQRMREFDNALVIMHLGRISQHPLFQKLKNEILSALTSNPLVEAETYLPSFNTKYVCFERFIVGGPIYLFEYGPNKQHHEIETLLYNWRSKILEHYGFNHYSIPSHHRITITNKTDSGRAKFARRSIANLNDVVKFVRTTYPRIRVDVVEWQHFTFRQQLEILLKTTILITPSGGVSMIGPFLPHSAHVIVMDSLSDRDNLGFKKGDSASLETKFWAHWHHVRKSFYQIYDMKEHVWDYEGANDTLHYASVIVNMTRLELLIDKALEDMSP
ncbi:unnamed protein product [Didymodactylos carnosus]|uniref:Glycosyltransferase 61 catalytic domain-containing protein n=1 Tax=Didymodactylos carnosus TaxID=1234261 RepID=A0A815NRH3_9BILA|nr:unnamed protein product [Didymodactylos carnosus]CAF4317349.1 unnamed protein product [Didymodactylos carnosus]